MSFFYYFQGKSSKQFHDLSFLLHFIFPDLVRYCDGYILPDEYSVSSCDFPLLLLAHGPVEVVSSLNCEEVRDISFEMRFQFSLGFNLLRDSCSSRFGY